MINADALKTNEHQKKVLARELRSILADIDVSIKKAHENNARNVDVPVPICFDIHGLNNTDAQRIIYHGVIKSLSERNFIVTISMTTNSTTFNIKWMSSEELNEIAEQSNVIALHTKK